MIPVLNKWQFHFFWGKDYRFFERGWKLFEIGIFKFKSLPQEGVEIHKSNYDGFIFRCYIWLPIDTYK